MLVPNPTLKARKDARDSAIWAVAVVFIGTAALVYALVTKNPNDLPGALIIAVFFAAASCYLIPTAILETIAYHKLRKKYTGPDQKDA